jgi:hypothetical protein
MASSSPRCGRSVHLPIFVLDRSNRPAFAFEAEDAETARRLARSRWLVQALDDFCRTRRPRPDCHGPLSLREATDDEAALFRMRADELAEERSCCLILHLA